MRSAPALGALLLAALAGCSFELPPDGSAFDPRTTLRARIDSLTALDHISEALVLAGARERAARSAGEATWRVREAHVEVVALEARYARPVDERAELAQADRALADADRQLDRDSLAAAATGARGALATRLAVLGPSVASGRAALLSAYAEYALGRVREADSLAQAARILLSAGLGELHPDLADIEELLGRVVKNFTGRIGREAAMAHYDRALAIRTQTLGAHSLTCAETLHEMGNLERLDQHPVVAVGLMRRALTLDREILGPVHDEVASTLSALAFVEAWQSHWAAAESLSAAVLVASPKETPIGSRSLRIGFHGQMLRRMGRDREAIPELRVAVALRESAWVRTTRDARSSIQSGLSIHRELSLALAAEGRGDEAFEELERCASRALCEHLLGDSAMAHDPWHGLVTRVQRVVPEDAALVAWTYGLFWMSDGDYPIWACVIRRDGPAHWVRLPRVTPHYPAGTIREALLFEMRNAASWPTRLGDTQAVQRLAREMGREWFTPLEPLLGGVRRLIVCSPDLMAGGPLGLLADYKGQPLAERFSISYTPSALLYMIDRERAAGRLSPGARPALLVGDPAYSPEDPEHHPRLVGTADEVRGIAARFPDATILIGPEASAARLRALATSGALARYGLLHFATHTSVNSRSAFESALVLAPDTRGGPRDSRMLAREIAATWKLDADLVCLTGCRSVVGLSSSSDGWLGLPQVLLGAGARSLLVSLWPVDDRATALLMREFYARLIDPARPENRADALRDAQLALRRYRAPDGRRPFEHPVYWAGFALVGDPG